MRLVTLALAVVFGCGPSSAEIQTAKTTRYASSDATALFDLAIEVTRRDYKIGEVDAAQHRFATAPQFYTKEGGRQSPGAGGVVMVDGDSVMLTLIVEIAGEGYEGRVVVVTPVTYQVVSGSPKPRELKPDDPSLPPWIHGRADALAMAIYTEAKPLAANQPQ